MVGRIEALGVLELEGLLGRLNKLKIRCSIVTGLSGSTVVCVHDPRGMIDIETEFEPSDPPLPKPIAEWLAHVIAHLHPDASCDRAAPVGYVPGLSLVPRRS